MTPTEAPGAPNGVSAIKDIAMTQFHHINNNSSSVEVGLIFKIITVSLNYCIIIIIIYICIFYNFKFSDGSRKDKESYGPGEDYSMKRSIRSSTNNCFSTITILPSFIFQMN